jgi:hypothetical protein
MDGLIRGDPGQLPGMMRERTVTQVPNEVRGTTVEVDPLADVVTNHRLIEGGANN